MNAHLKEIGRLTLIKTKGGLPWVIGLAIIVSLFAHNTVMEKVFIHMLYSAPQTREAREHVTNLGLRMVSFAKDPSQCATDVLYATLLVINPNKIDFGEPLLGWDTRNSIEKHIKESCQ